MAKHKKGGGRALDIIFSLVLLGGAAFGCYYIASHAVTIDQTNTYYVPEETPTEPEPDPNALQFNGVDIPNSDVHTGVMILVNNSIPCAEVTEDQLVSLYNKKLEAGSDSFSVRDAELYVAEPFADAIIAMLDDFRDATGDDNLMVLSGYRSQELQQQLYDEDLEATGNDVSERVAKPGYSEHQTGLGIDLTVYGEGDYDGTGVYAWIDEHCAEYGIILRYPEGKQSITDIQYEPWHYRYIGKPHAAYLMQNGIVMEEYYELLKTKHPYDGEHLRISDTDEKIYEVYYYPMDTVTETTTVAVPIDKEYTVCGNNSDGFIVTVDTGETGTIISESETISEEAVENTPGADEFTPDAPSEDAES